MAVVDRGRVAPTTTGLGLPSLKDVMLQEDPWGFYGQLLEAGDPVWDDGMDVWLVTSYDTQRTIFPLDDGSPEDEVYRYAHMPSQDDPNPFGLPRDTFLSAAVHGARYNPIFTTGETHARHHRWWMHVYSPRVLTSWSDKWIEPIMHARLDKLVAAGRADLTADYCDRVAAQVACATMGLPYDDEWIGDLSGHIKNWTNLFMALRGSAEPVENAYDLPDGLAESGLTASEELRRFLRPHVEERRSGEGDDFISLLWRDADELFGTDCDQTAEVISWTALAFIASGETQGYSSGSELYVLAKRPDLQEEIRGDEEKLSRFVEESLRLWGPQDIRVRVANHGSEINGVSIKQGDRVICLQNMGGRDPGHYGEGADEISLERKSPRDHFAFNMGPRMCPGHAPARLFLKAACAVALERLENLRLDPDAPPARWTTNFSNRRFEPVNVLFTPSAPRAARQ